MLKQRVVTALFLVASLFFVLFMLPARYAVLVFAGVAAVAAWEWAGLMHAGVRGRSIFPLLTLTGCALIQLYPQSNLPALALAGGFWLLLVPAWLVRRWPLAHSFLGYAAGLVVIMPAWVALVELYRYGAWLLLEVMAMVWVADIAAYFVGRAIGRRKLAPAISPGKTWEGAAGAILGGLIYGAALIRFGRIDMAINWTFAVFAIVILVVVSIMGDLFESLMKRQANVKDSSQLLPGHGGVLDRIDSLTSALPLAALSLYYLR